MPYQVTEPHPSVNTSKKSTYLLSGRGGAGNIARYPTSTLTSGPSATGPASRTSLPAPPTSARMMLTGRGGAGNAVRPLDRSSSTSTIVSTQPSPSTKQHRSSSQSSGSGADDSPAQQRAIFSFDEELARDQRMRDNAARVYHIGRGGAGNAFSSVTRPGQQVRKGSSAGSTTSGSSVESNGGKRGSVQGMMERLSKTLSRS